MVRSERFASWKLGGLCLAGQIRRSIAPRGAVTGEPPGRRTRDADLRISSGRARRRKPACRGREIGTRTNRPAVLRRLVRVPISRPHPRYARARPLADRRWARSPASHDPRDPRRSATRACQRDATSLAVRRSHGDVGRWDAVTRYVGSWELGVDLISPVPRCRCSDDPQRSRSRPTPDTRLPLPAPLAVRS